MLGAAAAKLEQVFDFTHGGFGRAPKFPHPMDLQVLMRIWFRTRRDGILDMVKLNLDKMARGGIYDHLAGGFARYSVDEQWLVPHFEKMLYDNALLTGAYLDGYLVTGNEEYARVARETLDYVLKYMTDEQGGFHSTEDADSEGEEGKFYVWTPDEIRDVLGAERAERFCYVYDVTDLANPTPLTSTSSAAIQRGNAIEVCPTCQRIIYWDQLFAEEKVEKAANAIDTDGQVTDNAEAEDAPPKEAAPPTEPPPEPAQATAAQPKD